MSNETAKPATAAKASPTKAAAAKTETTAEATAENILNSAVANFDFSGEKVSKMMEKSMKSVGEVTEFAKGNVEAALASAKAAAKGAEQISQYFVETSKKQFEEAQAVLKNIASVKSPNEAFQLQNDFAKSQFDAAVASWSKLSETMLKVAGDVTQPLSARVALATDNVKKAISA